MSETGDLQSGFVGDTGRPPLLERDAALARLGAALSAARSGGGRIVAVSGEAGVGKTSLVREFVAGLPEDFGRLIGGCEDLEAGRPLGPLLDMAGDLGADVESALKRHESFATVMDCLVDALRRSNHVMVIEDIHWADSTTLDMIRLLGRRISALPLVFVVTMRSDEPTSAVQIARTLGGLGHPDFQRVELAALSPESVRVLAKSVGRSSEGLYEATGGNPFFLTEILAATGSIGEKLPATIRDAVWARFFRFDEADQALMKVMSVIPGGTGNELVGDLLGEEGLDQVERLIGGGILYRQENGRIIFRHELARRAVLELMPASEGRRWHANIAEWYARHRDEGDMTSLAARLFHASNADDAQQVLAIAPALAEHASKVGAHRQASQFLGTALRFAHRMSPEVEAQTHETWSYEAGLAERIDADVIAARHRAIELWTALERPEKIGLNHRWLSRLHWYLGEADKSRNHLGQAIEILESIEPCDELAWSYSVRSQTAMLNDQFDDAIAWGQQALELADRLGIVEVRVHALNNIATSMLFSASPDRGIEMMRESLKLAIANGFHEQAARVYTNLGEYGLSVKHLDFAEQFIDEGIAFDSDHDLDSWLHYLRGCKAQLLMYRGELDEARSIATSVLKLTHITPVMKMGAALVVAVVNIRAGETEEISTLEKLLAEAERTGEPQRIIPVLVALAEASWTFMDLAGCAHYSMRAWKLSDESKPWEQGEIAGWLYRAAALHHVDRSAMPEPVALELAGRHVEAAAAWQDRGMMFEAALVGGGAPKNKEGGSRKSWIRKLAGMGAIATAKACRQYMNGKPDEFAYSAVKRGPYRHARADQFGLTEKERLVLNLLCDGASNKDIARRLNRSVRTVEHHVSAVIDKLQVENRRAAILKAMRDREHEYLIQ